MIRFVVGPDGQLVADLQRKLPGRGAWVTATRQALAQAIRRKAFARALKREVRVEPDLADRVEALLERSALDALGIAHKSGAVAAGFAKVEAAAAAKRRRPRARGRCRPGRGGQDRGRGEAPERHAGRAHPGHRAIRLGAIGFGTGQGKCDTCCPARGPGQRQLSCALSQPRTLPDRRSGGGNGAS
jgi:predicted RNA-binding protein YlxR (DUF448 family)